MLNHRIDCPGDLTCKKCGRKACRDCIHGKESNPKNEGLCVICSGAWKKNEILLHPEPKEWDA